MMIISMSILILMFYNALFYIIGDYVSKYTKVYHKTVAGFFIFFIFYFLIATPISVLRLSWNAFFISVSLLHIFLILFFAYQFIKHERTRSFSVEKMKRFLKRYGFICAVVILLVVLYLGSDRSILGVGNRTQLIIIDSAFYLAKAMKAIGVEHIGSFDPIAGKELEPIGQMITSLVTWEYLWSFVSVMTGLKVVVVSKLIFGVMILSKVVLTFSEVFENIFSEKKKTWAIFSAVILVFALYTMPDGHLQNELAKYFYLPFYGNVLTTTVMIPVIIFFFYKALANKNYLYALFLAPLSFFVFSTGALIVVLLTYPILVILWCFYKQYKIKYEKILVFVFFVIFLILNYGYIKLQKDVTAVEWVDWMMFFNHTLPIFLLALIGFMLQYHHKKLKPEEFTLVILFCIFFFICIFEKTSLFIFLKYKFSLRRYLIGALLFFFMYGISYLYENLKTNIKSLLVTTGLVFLLIQKLYTPVLIQDRAYFHFVENITNVKRVAPESEKLVNIVDMEAQGKKRLAYCYYFDYYALDGIELSPNRTLLPSVDLRALSQANVFDITHAGGTEKNPWERKGNCTIFFTDSEIYSNNAKSAGGKEIDRIYSSRFSNVIYVYKFE